MSYVLRDGTIIENVEFIPTGLQVDDRYIRIVKFSVNGVAYSQAFYRTLSSFDLSPWYPFNGIVFKFHDPVIIWFWHPDEENELLGKWASPVYLALSSLMCSIPPEQKTELQKFYEVFERKSPPFNKTDDFSICEISFWAIESCCLTLEEINKFIGDSVALNYPFNENKIKFDWNSVYDGSIFSWEKYSEKAKKYFAPVVLNPFVSVGKGKFVLDLLLRTSNMYNKNTNYGFIVSSLKTNIVKINKTIEDLNSERVHQCTKFVYPQQPPFEGDIRYYLEYYFGNGYRYINSFLRCGEPLKGNLDKIKMAISALDTAFSTKSKILDDEIILYRGMSGKMYSDGYLEKGYMSTTDNLDIFDDGEISDNFINYDGCCIIKIFVPKGMPIINSEEYKVYPGESEILLPRNLMITVLSETNKMQIVRVRETMPLH